MVVLETLRVLAISEKEIFEFKDNNFSISKSNLSIKVDFDIVMWF